MEKQVFKNIDEIIQFCNEHLQRKNDIELRQLETLNNREIYIQGMLEGIINGMCLMGFDINKIENLEEIK